MSQHEFGLVDDMARVKFYAARRLWPIRDEQTASGSETWAAWFARMFDESLFAYAARAKDTNVRERIKQYEIDTYGWSPLEADEKAA